ncbi:MAG: CPCC family cysteine-rich protein [Phycisphaerales bacterium]
MAWSERSEGHERAAAESCTHAEHALGEPEQDDDVASRIRKAIAENHPYFCPLCGIKAIDTKPPRSYDICPVCYWEDESDPREGECGPAGANEYPIGVAFRFWREFGTYFGIDWR